MMRSPQAISRDGRGPSGTGAPSGPVKTLSILLALLMLCTATTFAGARTVDRQVKLITGSVVLPISLVHRVGEVVRSNLTHDARPAHPHLDPHRRLPAASHAGAVARKLLRQPSVGVRG